MTTPSSVPLPLADAVLHLMAFLELSDETVVDPDDAVAALESANHDLQRLSPEQRLALAARAAELAATSRDARTAEFLAGFAEAGGLLDGT